MKRLIAALVFLVFSASGAFALNCSGYSYTFVNGQIADASQVNSNFNTIMNCANNNLAHNGANSDITSLSGLTTPLSPSQGGTAVYVGGTSAGTANAQTVATVVPSNFALTAGNIVTFIAGSSNTSSMTLAVNSTTATAVKRISGGALADTISGDVISGVSYSVQYDGTEYVLFNPSTLGDATAATINNLAITKPASTATLAIASGKTLTDSNTLTFTGTDGSTVAFGSGGTVSYASAIEFCRLTYQVSSGTGGEVYSASSWNIVNFNTISQDPSSIASLTSKKITLAAGTYVLDASVALSFSNTAQPQIRIFNSTTTSNVAFANGGGGGNASDHQVGGYASVHTIYVSNGTDALEIDIDPGSQPTVAQQASGTGNAEVYAQFTALKIS